MVQILHRCTGRVAHGRDDRLSGGLPSVRHGTWPIVTVVGIAPHPYSLMEMAQTFVGRQERDQSAQEGTEKNKEQSRCLSRTPVKNPGNNQGCQGIEHYT